MWQDRVVRCVVLYIYIEMWWGGIGTGVVWCTLHRTALMCPPPPRLM